MVPPTCAEGITINLGDYIPLSTLDWPGRASVVFFLRGCPFRCPYCQNHSILSGSDPVDPGRIGQLIEASRLFVSSVVFSGGEPLNQGPVIPEIARIAKQKGLDVGIHTNGAYPEVLRKLCEKDLIDGVFIDLKAPLDDPQEYGRMAGCGQYPAVTLSPAEIAAKVRESIAIAADYGILKELRTTVLPGFMDSPSLIGAAVLSALPYLKASGAPYVIQQGIPSHSLDPSLRDLSPLSRQDMIRLAVPALKHLNNIWVRTSEKGCERVRFGMV